MPKVIAKYLFNKLAGSREVREMMEMLHAVSGMDVLLLDALGVVRVAAPRQTSTAFVRLLRAQPQTAAHLERERQARLSGQGASASGGLQEIVKEIEVEGEIAGYLLLSAHRQAWSDLQWVRDLWRDLARAGTPVYWLPWQDAWRKLPALRPEQVAAWRRTMSLHILHVLQRIENLRGGVGEGHAMPPLVASTCLRIREQFHERLRLQDLAAELGVCPEHISRLFHASTGMRFCEYLAETRIEAACEALAHTEHPIARIAHDCGFSSLSRFNRCFRSHRDMTPSAWRKRIHIQQAPG